jgi:imidazolonepropionase-like amidohydrolase
MAAFARAAAAAGVPLATGTDWFTPDADPFPSVIVEIETLVERGVLTPLGVIEAATRNGARLLRLEDEQGTIAPGMLANVVVLRENPAADIGALRSVETVIKRGRFYPRTEYEAGGAAGDRR